MKRLIVLLCLAAAFSMVSAGNSPALAAEGGAGHYVPGALADFGDMFPTTGLALVNWYNYYSGSAGAGRQFPFGGVLAANLSATANAELFGAMYTFPWNVLEGKYYAAVIMPYV